MSSQLNIKYRFSFLSGEAREISLYFDEDTLALVPDANYKPPEWAELVLNQCTVCPLDPALHRNCPTAVHMSLIADNFSEHYSFDEVTIEVSDGRRRYIKETSLQEGLGSLMGIIMATGGCPVLEPLRPMVRFHLPFATMEETEFRMVSMYLVAQYLRLKNGEQPDWTLDGLKVIYDRVQDVNTVFAMRIRNASGNDAGINAIIILDCFAKAVPFAINNLMKDYEKFFYSYSRSVPVE